MINRQGKNVKVLRQDVDEEKDLQGLSGKQISEMTIYQLRTDIVINADSGVSGN